MKVFQVVALCSSVVVGIGCEGETALPYRGIAGATGAGGATAHGTGGTAAAGTGGAAAGLGGAGGGIDPAARFLGTWEPLSGTVLVTCNGATEGGTVSSPDIFARGTSSDLVMVDDTCPLRFSIAGNTATIVAGDQCTDPSSGLTLRPTAWTFTTADGTVGTEAASGYVDGLIIPGTTNPVTCPFTESATYQKTSN